MEISRARRGEERRGERASEHTAFAYEIRQRARAPLRRKVKAPVKDVWRNARVRFPLLSRLDFRESAVAGSRFFYFFLSFFFF